MRSWELPRLSSTIKWTTRVVPSLLHQAPETNPRILHGKNYIEIDPIDMIISNHPHPTYLSNQPLTILPHPKLQPSLLKRTTQSSSPQTPRMQLLCKE